MACLPRCPVRRRNAAVVCLRTAGWTHHDEPPLTAPLPPRAEALRVTAPITPARYPPSPSLDKYWLLADICALVSGRVTHGGRPASVRTDLASGNPRPNNAAVNANVGIRVEARRLRRMA